ncbi:acyl-thioesterase 2 [Grosmannia clavigera kw1407]|uniref:Acyl-thioesterase 2 n=1 Tax=Grosmannia clavigera (strain kw1407 / UAMH 11150) TaxID=655863 RepID=F0XJ23_GROCL|nr:acyl-thioesterase 2 [Grosmannia clavigera kw1407]EFX02096.1 acyl-thioesterase 2 [Grosmannia clavigera kw1407]
MTHPTMMRPPPVDPARSMMENNLEVTEMSVLGPDVYTNARPPWHPPGARGIYGGSVVSMCLAAGQRTVEPDFAPHSCHCYFLLAGNAAIPILLHVERVRDGRSFATRTVQARQRGRCIFTLTVSFARMPPKDTSTSMSTTAPLHHAVAMPTSRPLQPPADWDDDGGIEPRLLRALGIAPVEQPVVAGPMHIVGDVDALPHRKKTQQWVRVRGRISAAGGRAAHLCALAYLSDRYFIGTICRLHRLWRLPFSVESVLGEDDVGDEKDDDDDDTTTYNQLVRSSPSLRQLIRQHVEAESGGVPLEAYRGRPRLGMVVSLDHTVYFHEPDRVCADDWMLVEMDSPWANSGRGVVTQRIFSKDGMLLATCVQEVRAAENRTAVRGC